MRQSLPFPSDAADGPLPLLVDLEDKRLGELGPDVEGGPIPTAPVPFGGALIYVPVDWVRPANIGVDKLTEIYVSMGITAPPTRR